MSLKKQIVAVDDSGIVLKMLETLLSGQYEYHAFSKGMRALKYLKENTPDLIILDIDMPEIDGFEILEMLKKNMFLKEVPVIFLTSNNDKNHVVKAVQGGANDYIVKPIKQEILMDKIHTLLKEDKKGKLSWDDI
jgi:PleD family two-component response regulator